MFVTRIRNPEFACRSPAACDSTRSARRGHPGITIYTKHAPVDGLKQARTRRVIPRLVRGVAMTFYSLAARSCTKPTATVREPDHGRSKRLTNRMPGFMLAGSRRRQMNGLAASDLEQNLRGGLRCHCPLNLRRLVPIVNKFS